MFDASFVTRRRDQTQAAPWSRGEIWTHRSPSTRRPVSALPVTRKAVDVFDHPGLFMVPFDRPRAMSAAAKTHEPPAMRPGRARVAPTDRHKGGLHRYCSGCAQETEHVAWADDGRGSTPSIRWGTTEPAIGTTICLNCGQWRAASPNLRLGRGQVGPEVGSPRQAWPSPLTPPTP